MNLIFIFATVALYVRKYLSLISLFWIKTLSIILATLTVIRCFYSIKKFKLISLIIAALLAMAQITLLTQIL